MIDRLRAFAGARLTRLFAGTFAVAATSRLLLFLMTVMLGRQFGPDGLGTFTFATGAAMLIGFAATLGWPNLMVRFIPQYLHDRDWSRLKGLVRTGAIVVLVSSILASAILALVSRSPGLSPEIATGLLLAAVATLPFALRKLRRQQLAAFQRPALGLFLDEALAPALVILVLLVTPIADPAIAIYVYSATGLVAAMLGAVALARLMPAETRHVAPLSEPSRWMGIALPTVLGLAGYQLMNKADVLMLAPLSTFDEVGAYGAAFRITYLLTFPQVVLATVVTPVFARLVAAGNVAGLRRRYRMSFGFALVTSAPLAAVLAAFPHFVMTIAFGEAFGTPSATWSLAILALGQTFTALAVPTQGLLLVSGRERAFGAINGAALVINIALNLLLIPPLGAIGAAIASASSAAFVFVLQFARALAVLRGGLHREPASDPDANGKPE